MNMMIFGAGFSGLAIARELAGECGFAGGTTRGPARFDQLRAAGLVPFVYEGGQPSADLGDALSRTTHLVMSIAPDSGGDPLLDAFAG
ncbi:MAG: NAD(P)-dependent oxidoreductase, partial [Hoeflea sp.]|nr:NAD(P)-dependent oxidoreductase [Hoeflea sp.]